MAEILRPELCIVGAGALGIALAKHAKALGAGVLLVDRGTAESGDGPERALRIAALAASAAAAAASRAGARLGIGATEPRISMKAVQERALQIAAGAAPVFAHERLAALGIEVVAGQTRFIDPASLMVGDVVVRPQTTILALGGACSVPPIPGLEEAGYFTPDTILENARKLTHLLVIGGDPEGLALGQAFARLGSEVTLVPQGWALAGFDVETASILMHSLGAEGLRIMDGSKVRSVQARSQGIGVAVEPVEGGEQTLDVSHILVCHGRDANLVDLEPDLARLRPLRGDANRYGIGALGQTSNRRIRAVGAVAGMKDWNHALSHGRSVVEALVTGAPRHRTSAQPRLVMTEPALAQIGRLPTESGKVPQGHELHRVNLAENECLRAQGESGGLIKAVTDPKGRLLGASLVGPGAADMAGVLALAMDRGLPIELLTDLSLPRPSVMSSLVALGENRKATRTVSSWARGRGAIMRLIGR